MKLVFIFIIHVLTIQSRASSIDCDLNVIVSRAMNDPCIYMNERCHLNVVSLSKEFAKNVENYDPKKANYIFIFGDYPKGFTRQSGSRYDVNFKDSRHGPTSWDYHVVLEYEGKIYDLDASPSTKAVSVEEYFKNVETDLGPSGVRLRMVPSLDFEKMHGLVERKSLYVSAHRFVDDTFESLYPEKTVSELLTETPTSTPSKNIWFLEGPQSIEDSPLRFIFDEKTKQSTGIGLEENGFSYYLDFQNHTLTVFENQKEIIAPDRAERFINRIKRDMKEDETIAFGLYRKNVPVFNLGLSIKFKR